MVVLIISFLIVLLDQVTKYVVTRQFTPEQSLGLVPGFLNLTYVRNTGAAWGMLGGLNGWLALLSIVILVLILRFRRSFLVDGVVHRVALACMIAGIVGNLLDRVRLQYVVDFIDFHWGVHHFPSFNVADSAICVGAGLYIISSLWMTGHPLNAQRGADGAAVR
jgi:signal peptidase II